MFAPVAGIALAAILVLSPTAALAWGNTGHRIVGAIAEHYLGGDARSAVKAILGPESLAEASTWPDFMRQSPDPYWRTAGAFHTVVVDGGGHYDGANVPTEGDAFVALGRFAATLRDSRAPLGERQRALRFVIHIVGDLQQPLHACNGRDHCGGDIAVTFFGSPMNLHQVWDYGLIDHEQLAYSEWASWLIARLGRDDVGALDNPDPRLWITESAALGRQIYPADPVIGKDYAFANKAIVEQCLTKGGLRLAAYLNALFRAR